MATNNAANYSPTQYNVQVGGASGTLSNVAPSATSGIPLVSGGSSANPSFTTAVVAGGGTGAVTFTAYAPILAGTTSTGAFQSASTGLSTSGYVLTSTGASSAPTFQAAAFVGFTYTVITANQNAAVNNGYICNKASNLTLTLPTTAAVGTVIVVTGMNTALGWTIAQNASQQIFFGTSSTTSGTGGSLSSTNIYDTVTLVCNVANTSWIVTSSIGNITVV